MIFKILVASSAVMMGSVEATYVYGKCPTVKSWSEIHPKEKFNPARIKGYWGSVWENNIKMLSAECQSMKLEQISKKDPYTYKMYTGVSWKPMEEVVYDDSMVLHFNDPSEGGDPSKATITNVEDINMVATDASQMTSFNMRKIPKDVEYKMDYQDVELFYQYQREMDLQRDMLQANMDSGDRATHPYSVLDTDYKNYLVMYRCRDTFRKAVKGDDLNPVVEDHRQIMEDFDEDRHPQLLANKTIGMAGPNESFKELVKMINGTSSDEVGEDQLQEELNAFMNYEQEGTLIFKDRTPNVDEWKLRRDNYLVQHGEEENPDEAPAEEEEKLPEDERWFHDMRISVFMRRPFNVKDEMYKELAEKTKSYIPAFNWDELTQYVEHKEENCIRGDIFKHPSAKKFEDLTLFDRGPQKQTQEMFDQYEEDYKKKVASGEIKEDDEGEGGEGGEDQQDQMGAEEIKQWQQEQEDKRKARGGGSGMKKVQDMLDGMGMAMVTEEEAMEQEKAKKAKKGKAKEAKQDYGVKDDL